jgi:hypothetical protein
VGVGVGSISGFPILGFFDFGTSILGQGVGVDVDVEGILLGPGVLAVRLSLILGRGAGTGGAGGAGGAEGRRFRGIFSFNISYLGRESQWRGGAGQNDNFLLFCSIFWWGRCKKG